MLVFGKLEFGKLEPSTTHVDSKRAPGIAAPELAEFVQKSVHPECFLSAEGFPIGSPGVPFKYVTHLISRLLVTISGEGQESASWEFQLKSLP